MTRTKEVDPNSGEMPDYKSCPSRIVHSLRKGYDNVRAKLQETRNKIKYYQIKTRDLETSRKRYKEETAELKTETTELKKKMLELEAEIVTLKKQNEENEKKKRK